MLVTATTLVLVAALGAEPASSDELVRVQSKSENPIRTQFEVGGGLGLYSLIYPFLPRPVVATGVELTTFRQDVFFLGPTIRAEWRHEGTFPDPLYASGMDQWYVLSGVRVGAKLPFHLEVFLSAELGTGLQLSYVLDSTYGWNSHTWNWRFAFRGGVGLRALLFARIVPFVLAEGGGSLALVPYYEWHGVLPMVTLTAGVGIRL